MGFSRSNRKTQDRVFLVKYPDRTFKKYFTQKYVKETDLSSKIGLTNLYTLFKGPWLGAIQMMRKLEKKYIIYINIYAPVITINTSGYG